MREASGIRKLLVLVAVLVAGTLVGRPLLSSLAPERSDANPSAAVRTTELPVACRAGATKVSAVQGAGQRSPLVGQDVTIQGVVVATFQQGYGGTFGYDLGGFYVQEEDSDADADPRTSEGVFVHEATLRPSVGDLVRVTGRVAEFNDLTEITRVQDVVTCAQGLPLPTPAAITLPVASLADLEAFEGMLVAFPQDLVIGDYQDFDRYGEIVLTLPGGDGKRTLQPTAYLAPGSREALAAADLAARSRIVLDDGRTTQNPHPPRHPNGREFTAANGFRGGDVVRGLTGVLDHAFGSYRVQPTRGATTVAANPRPTAPEAVGGRLRVAGFNVLNYFTTLRGGSAACGPRRDQDCRGADTAAEFRRQRDKIVAALAKMDAHVLGLTELENDPTGAALADLVDALNAATAAGRYAAVRTGGAVGGDVIRVAILYQPAYVRPVAVTAVLDDRSFIDPTRSGEARNRAAMAQAFEEVGSGERFTVVVKDFM
jgi:predicted extracellular nuclease